MSMVEATTSIFSPQGSFTGRSLGDCLTTFLLWHPLFLTSNGGSLVWGGAGTPVQCMMGAHTQGNANLLCNEKKSVSVEDSWPSTLVCHFIRGDISCDLMHYLPSLFFPPILDLPLSLPGIAFTSTRSPGFRFTAPIFLLYYHFCWHASMVDWACASNRAVLKLSLTEAMYMSTCLAETSLMGASLLPTVGKTKLTQSLGHHPNIK